MKAIVKAQAAPGLWLQEVPKPQPGEDDVLIRIKRTSICGTDVHIYEWDEWAQKNIRVPLTIGHEYSGVIEAIGSRVDHLQVGQKVSGEGHIVGMHSRHSRAGKFHLDPHTRGVGIHRPGGFAEYLVLPAFNVIPLPDDLDLDIGAILDPFGNAVHAALSFDLVGEDVLITGAGPIGIMAAAVARHAGARHIVITDLNDTRLELAGRMVDVRPMNVRRETLPKVMAELHMQEGFDIGLEMSGSPAAFDEMVEVMIMGGNIALLGIPAEKALVDWSKIIFKALTIKAIYGREMFETWYKMLAILNSGLDLRPIITHHFAVEQFEEGFKAMQSGQAGKVILRWD